MRGLMWFFTGLASVVAFIGGILLLVANGGLPDLSAGVGGYGSIQLKFAVILLMTFVSTLIIGMFVGLVWQFAHGNNGTDKYFTPAMRKSQMIGNRTWEVIAKRVGRDRSTPPPGLHLYH
jgi:heme/copper-type cytochrome/quinol oxidase subunit 2